MRRFALLAGALLAAASPASAQTGAVPDYVPDDIGRNADHAKFLERWFGNQLHAMHEPVLSHRGGLGPYRRRFRMLVLPYGRPAYAVRVDESAAGGRMRIVRLDGNGDSVPGHIARQRQLTLSRDDLRALNTLIRASGLTGMAAQPPPYEQSPPDPVTGETSIEICLHSTYYVFELVAGAESKFAYREECNMPDGLRALIDDLREARRDAGFR